MGNYFGGGVAGVISEGPYCSRLRQGASKSSSNGSKESLLLFLQKVTTFEHVIHAVDGGEFGPILACFQGGGVLDVGIRKVICW